MVDTAQDANQEYTETENVGDKSLSGGSATSHETGKKNSTWRDILDTWTKYFRTHRNQVIFAAAGLFVALGFLIIGFWATFLLIIFVYGGILYGRYRDGDQRIIARVKKILDMLD